MRVDISQLKKELIENIKRFNDNKYRRSQAVSFFYRGNAPKYSGNETIKRMAFLDLVKKINDQMLGLSQKLNVREHGEFLRLLEAERVSLQEYSLFSIDFQEQISKLPDDLLLSGTIDPRRDEFPLAFDDLEQSSGIPEGEQLVRQEQQPSKAATDPSGFNEGNEIALDEPVRKQKPQNYLDADTGVSFHVCFDSISEFVSVSTFLEEMASFDLKLSHKGTNQISVTLPSTHLVPNNQAIWADYYKELMLKTWKALVDAKVNLHFATPEGATAIQVGRQIPSPFSYTSEKKNHSHPLEIINFTYLDLHKHKINNPYKNLGSEINSISTAQGSKRSQLKEAHKQVKARECLRTLFMEIQKKAEVGSKQQWELAFFGGNDVSYILDDKPTLGEKHYVKVPKHVAEILEKINSANEGQETWVKALNLVNDILQQQKRESSAPKRAVHEKGKEFKLFGRLQSTQNFYDKKAVEIDEVAKDISAPAA